MPKIKIYRVKEPGRHAVLNPQSNNNGMIVPDPSIPYRADHPLVEAYPWMFIADEDRVEAATSDPGEKRRVGRPPLPRDENGNVIRD